MKTKKKREPEFESIGNSDTAATVEQAQVNAMRRERFQLSFDLNEDGSPDLSSMRDKTRDRVREFFSDPAMAKVFGAKPPAQPEAQIFHPSMVAGMYAMLGTVEALAVARIANIPQPICKQVFTYTPAEIEALTGPTVRVLNKYVADWMIKYQDELALATILGSLTLQKVQYAMALAKMQSANIAPNGSQQKNAEPGQKEDADTGVPN